MIWANTEEKQTHLECLQATYVPLMKNNKPGKTNVPMRNFLRQQYIRFRETFDQDIGTGDTEAKRETSGMDRLRSYLNNHCVEFGRKRRCKKVVAVIEEPGKKTRKRHKGLTVTETYHREFNTDAEARLTAEFDEFCIAQKVQPEDRPHQKIGFRATFLSKQWAALPMEKQQEVRMYIEEEKKRRKEKELEKYDWPDRLKMKEGEGDRRYGAMDYARATHNIPILIRAFEEKMRKDLGATVLIAVGYQQPVKGGNPRFVTSVSGTDLNGQTFDERFSKTFELLKTDYASYVKGVYSAERIAQMALPVLGCDDAEDDDKVDICENDEELVDEEGEGSEEDKDGSEEEKAEDEVGSAFGTEQDNFESFGVDDQSTEVHQEVETNSSQFASAPQIGSAGVDPMAGMGPVGLGSSHYGSVGSVGNDGAGNLGFGNMGDWSHMLSHINASAPISNQLSLPILSSPNDTGYYTNADGTTWTILGDCETPITANSTIQQQHDTRLDQQSQQQQVDPRHNQQQQQEEPYFQQRQQEVDPRQQQQIQLDQRSPFEYGPWANNLWDIGLGVPPLPYHYSAVHPAPIGFYNLGDPQLSSGTTLLSNPPNPNPQSMLHGSNVPQSKAEIATAPSTHEMEVLTDITNETEGKKLKVKPKPKPKPKLQLPLDTNSTANSASTASPASTTTVASSVSNANNAPAKAKAKANGAISTPAKAKTVAADTAPAKAKTAAAVNAPPHANTIVDTSSAQVISVANTTADVEPKWIREYKKYFYKLFSLSDNQNAKNRELVDKFLLLEKGFGYKPNVKGIVTEKQPSALRWFVERSHDCESDPPVTKLLDGASTSIATNAGKFASIFIPYYNSLMPKWRAANRAVVAKQSPGKDKDFHQWSKIGRGGKNGISLIVLGLGWWFHELNPNNEGNAEDSAKYTSVVDDFIWVLDCLSVGANAGHLTWAVEEEEAPARGSRKRTAVAPAADPPNKEKKKKTK